MKIDIKSRTCELKLRDVPEGEVFYYNFGEDPNFYIRGEEVPEPHGCYKSVNATHLSTGTVFTFHEETDVIAYDATLIVRAKEE